jgi:transposase InsO family protein
MPTLRADEDALTQAIIALASQYGRYGYRRITALLQRIGWKVGRDRVQRIWRREGLQVPRSTSHGLACGSTTARAFGSDLNEPITSGASTLSRAILMMEEA